jgi:hypothetical protein
MSALNAELLDTCCSSCPNCTGKYTFPSARSFASSIRPFSTRMDPQPNHHNPWHHFFSSSHVKTEIVRSNSSLPKTRLLILIHTHWLLERINSIPLRIIKIQHPPIVQRQTPLLRRKVTSPSFSPTPQFYLTLRFRTLHPKTNIYPAVHLVDFAFYPRVF